MSAVTFAPPLKIQRKGPINQKMMAGIVDRKIRDHREEFIENGLLALEGDEELWRISAASAPSITSTTACSLKTSRTRSSRCCKKFATSALKLKAAKAAKTAALMSEIMLVAHAEPQVEPAAAKEAGCWRQSSGSKDKADAKVAGKAAEPIAPPTEGITATYTGLVPLVYKAQRDDARRPGLELRHRPGDDRPGDDHRILGSLAGLILLIPSVFPLVVVFGVMGWMGIVIDVGTIMTPTVALGVSVDDVVHFLIWYRKGLKEGRGRHARSCWPTKAVPVRCIKAGACWPWVWPCLHSVRSCRRSGSGR